MRQETNQIRIICFDWDEAQGVTVSVKDRLITLPQEIEVRKEAYYSEEVRKKMEQNLMEKLWADGYSAPDNIDKLQFA